jgi:hypothetical protein
MNAMIQELIDALRNELQEYGEMLALLENQQEQVLARQAQTVLDNVTLVNRQAGVLHRVRSAREESQREVARSFGLEETSALYTIAHALPQEFQPLVLALVKENNQLLGRVQTCARQNHLLLSRCVELMQRTIQSLAPGNATTVYGGNGSMRMTTTGSALYEAVG